MKPKIYDVCIIGAGISGLFCAYLLSHDPLINICLIEKSPRVGGRVKSKNWKSGNETFVLEHGAYRFNPKDHPILKGIIDHFRLSKYVYELESTNVFFPLVNEWIVNSLKNAKEKKDDPVFHKIGVLVERFFDDYGKSIPIDDAARMYGYPADFEINASWFEGDEKTGSMNSKDTYYSMIDTQDNKGLTMITDCLHETLKESSNVDVLLGTFVQKLKNTKDHSTYTLTCENNNETQHVVCNSCFIGLPMKALKKIKGNTVQSFDHLLHCIKEGDYMRLYAHFPVGYNDFLNEKGFPFLQMPKIIGKTFLGQIVPHEQYDNIVMISYCEDDDVSKMMDIVQPQSKPQDKKRVYSQLSYYIEKHVDTFFEWMEKYCPEKNTLYKPYQNIWKQFLTSFDDLNMGMWESVIGKWKSRIPIQSLHRQMCNPQRNLYLIGEAISEHNQGWIEGALETAYESYKLYKGLQKNDSKKPSMNNLFLWNELHPGGSDVICPYVKENNLLDLKTKMNKIHHGNEAFVTLNSLMN